MTETEGDFQWAAEQVVRRRGHLGMTQEDVRAAGGPATATVRQIESGRPQAYQSTIKRKLENALKWPHGYYDDLLARREHPDPDSLAANELGNAHEQPHDHSRDRATPEEIVITLQRAAQRDRELGRNGTLFWATWDVVADVNHPRQETPPAPARDDRSA